MKNLRSFFNEDRIAVITSQVDVFDWLKARNIEVHMLDSLTRLPTSVVDLCGSVEHHSQMRSLIEKSPHTKLISIPQSSFDGSCEALLYSFKQLLNSDCIASLKKQGKLLPLFERTSKIHFRGNKASGNCLLQTEIEISTLEFTDLSPGTTCSVAQLFEISIDHANSLAPAPFDISGTFKFSGLLAARSPRYSGDFVSPKYIQDLLAVVAKSTYAEVIIEKNLVVSAKVDGVDIKAFMGAMTGPRGLYLTEFAIGLNNQIKQEIDWGMNSQLNEGIEGIHFGIGDGTSGLHIDILCPDVICNFEFDTANMDAT